MIIRLLKKTVQKLYVIKQWLSRGSQNVTFVISSWLEYQAKLNVKYRPHGTIPEEDFLIEPHLLP